MKLLPPAYEVQREVMFSVCSRPRGVPHLEPIILPLVPCSFWGHPSDWSQVPCWEGIPQFQAGEYPSPRWYPSSRWVIPQDGVAPGQDGVPPARMGTPMQDWGTTLARIGYLQVWLGYPQPGWGTPRPWDRSCFDRVVRLLRFPTGELTCYLFFVSLSMWK